MNNFMICQEMFPKIDNEIISLITNENENLEICIEILLELNSNIKEEFESQDVCDMSIDNFDNSDNMSLDNNSEETQEVIAYALTNQDLEESNNPLIQSQIPIANPINNNDK